MSKVKIIDHPLITHKLSFLRDKSTSVHDFRDICCEISMLMAYEAMSDLELEEVEIQTPVAFTKAYKLTKKLALVGILRAGNIMVEGFLRIFPCARAGHIGLYRDPKTLRPIKYYSKLPTDFTSNRVFLLDPMLATGGSAVVALNILKETNMKNISLLVMIASPEGIESVHANHNDVEIITAAKDSHLNDHGYIVPGLGDAGDRIYGTL